MYLFLILLISRWVVAASFMAENPNVEVAIFVADNTYNYYVWFRVGWSFFFGFIWNTSCSQDNTRKSYNDLFPVWQIDDMWGFRVGGGVHDSYTFQCGLVGSFTSPGIDTR